MRQVTENLYPFSQYFRQNLSCLFDDDAIVTKGFVIRAGFFHIPSDLVVTRRFSHHTLALAMGYPHHVSSAPTAICMEMRHGPDRQSDTQKPHDHR